MRRPIVAGNWKMHGSRAENARLVHALVAELTQRADGSSMGTSGASRAAFQREPGSTLPGCVVCPPFVYLEQVAELIEGTWIELGAQNLSAEAQGAFTGEVSAAMLEDLRCAYVIVGHSERRSLFGEDDQTVARKFSAALTKKLIPILCVGEQLAEREAGRTYEVVERQLEAVLALCGVESLARAVIAYEPVWAIGTGRNATPEQAQDVHSFIRGRLSERDARIAAGVRILYGGSVKAGNAAELFAMPDVDGGLIGGASLKADEFLTIVEAARQ